MILAGQLSSGKLGGREVKTSPLVSRRTWVRIPPESPVKCYNVYTRRCRAKLNQGSSCHPSLHQITSANHHILHTSDRLQRAIPEEPMIAFRCPRSLRKLVVWAEVPPTKEGNNRRSSVYTLHKILCACGGGGGGCTSVQDIYQKVFHGFGWNLLEFVEFTTRTNGLCWVYYTDQWIMLSLLKIRSQESIFLRTISNISKR